MDNLEAKIMKNIILLSCLLSPLAFASQNFSEPVTSSTSMSRHFTNPAGGFGGSHYSTGVLRLEPIAVGYEMGDVASLMDELDDLQSALEGSFSSTAEADEAEEKFDKFLEAAGKEGYAKVIASGSAIFLPTLFENGGLNLEFTAGGVVKLSVLDDDDGVTISGSTGLTTDSAVYEQRAYVSSFGLGYRKAVWSNDYGDLIVGAKLNATQMQLTRKVSTIFNLYDEEDEGVATSINLGADAGFLWVSDNMIFGLSATNINEPEYDLAELGSNCSNRASGAAEDNCDASVLFSDYGDISLSGHYTAEMKTTAEFSLAIASRALSIFASYDLNSTEDVTGDDYQWAQASITYFSDAFYLPGLRVGLKKNLAGTELAYVNAGVTLLNYINVDAGTTLESSEISGITVPRSAYINLGLAAAF